MKIAIISDIHGNLAALNAFPEKDYDALRCIGDLVDYGPRPSEVIHLIQTCATVAVSGNHDFAAGYARDPKCTVPYRKLAAETLNYITRQVCTGDDLEFLRSLPLHREVTLDSTRFYLVHAIPSDPLFGYCAQFSDRWEREVAALDTDFLVVGHTHTPFTRKAGKTTIINPGSLGQPKTGHSLACYAVWEDGEIFLREYHYPVAETAGQIRQMPLSPEDQDDLISVLETGVLPTRQFVRSAATN